MNDNERDEALGAALRQLPVPDHEPGFWDDLAGRLGGETGTTVTSLDQQRHRRPRRRTLVPLGAVAAVVVALLGVSLVASGDNKPGNQVATADRPGEGDGAAAPAMVTAAYTVRGAPEQSHEIRYQLTVADDGSFRWTSEGPAGEDGLKDLAYDAAAGRAVEIGELADGRVTAYVTTDVPAGGPDRGIRVAEPLVLADYVVSLARAGDKRVTEAAHGATGRPVWRYDGPRVEDRLGEGPDSVVAEIDRDTGVALEVREKAKGQIFRQLSALTVETSDELDRSRFQIRIPASAKTSEFSRGFRPTTLDQARAAMPYPVLVPDDLPDGFQLDAVAINKDTPSGTGAEGMNPPVADIVVLAWRKGFLSVTVTLRPTSDQEWSDPFGAEGMVFASTPVRTELAGRPPLGGELVVDPPARSHLWGLTGDIVVTADGDLTAAEFLSLAESLRS